MSNFFTFSVAVNEYLNNTWNPATSNYYIHLVTAAPTINQTQVSQLTLVSDSGYAPANVTVLDFTNGVLNISSGLFERYSGTSSVIGAVLCRRIGSTPASTDRLIAYSRLRNASGGLLSIVPTSQERVRVSFPNGAIQFQSIFAYSSGNWTGAWPINDGIFWLLGTNNGTIAYDSNLVATNSNTGSPKILGIADNSITPANFSRMVDRSTTSGAFWSFSSGNNLLVLDFRNRRIRVGDIRIFVGSLPSTSIFRVDITNELPGFTVADANLDSNWTATAVTSQTISSTGWQSFLINSTTYARYVRIKMTNSGAGNFQELEFFNSIITSATQDLVGV